MSVAKKDFNKSEEQQMKALFYNSNKIKEDNIIWGLIEVGIDVVRSELFVELDIIDSAQVEMIASEVRDYDFVITRDFSVNVAEGCHITGISYIAWAYDSPLKALYCKEAMYDTNYIFVFDKQHLARLKEMDIPHVYYQPLVANVTRAMQVTITDEDIRQYEREISFVGSMYDKHYFEAFRKRLTEKQVFECEKLFDRHLCNWNGNDSVFDELSEKTIQALYMQMSKKNRNLYSMSDRYITELLVLVTELTSRERSIFLKDISHRYDVVVNTYEPERFSDITSVRWEPPVEWDSDDLYRIYASAKININLTMRSIETGLPQRIYDIMSVGGCVFTNYQSEAEELFEQNREIVTFKSTDEFKEKADYYLKHDKERLELGARAYLKVRDKYNYPNAIRFMISKL